MEKHMAVGRGGFRGWSSWTVQVKVWKLVVGLLIVSLLVMWFRIVHQNDEILALIRNEVVTDNTGQRTWAGSFVNTNERALRDVAVTVDFLDRQNRTVGRTGAEAAELPFGARLVLGTKLPAEAVRLRIYSVQWRMGQTAALMGPFREPWEFGYLMTDPVSVNP
jgi:hypothetical protein